MGKDKALSLEDVLALALKYLEGKGQIASAFHVSVVAWVNDYVKQQYGPDLDLGLDKLLDKYLQLSEVEKAQFDTVYQRNLDKLFGSMKNQLTLQQYRQSPIRIMEALVGRKRQSQEQEG